MKNLITILFLAFAGVLFAQPVRTTITDDGVNVTVQTPVNIKVIPICDFHWVFVDGQLKLWIEGRNELIPGGRLGNFTINGATTQETKLAALGAISDQCAGGGGLDSLYLEDGTLLVSGDTIPSFGGLSLIPAGFAITSSEKIATPDSTYTFQQQVNQIRDSTIFSAPSASEITNISTSLKDGDRVKVKTTGLEYLVQPDSVMYYVVDDSLVIDLGGKYAVVDFSQKRTFIDYQELKKLSPLCNFTGKTERVVAGSEEIIVSATPIAFAQSPEMVDTLVDGYFLDTMNLRYDGGNLFRWSELSSQRGAGSTDRAITNTAAFTNFTTGPTGKKNATAIVSGVTYIYIVNGSNSMSIPTYTFSCWARVKNGKTGVSMTSIGFGTSASQGTISINEPTKWKRYSVTFSGPASLPDNALDFSVSGLTGDTLLIAQAQVEAGTVMTDYKETNFMLVAKPWKMYINRGASIIRDGELDISLVHGQANTAGNSPTNDTEFLQSAMNYCDQGRRCNEVLLGRAAYNIDSTLVMKDHVRLTGAVVIKSQLGTPKAGDMGTEFYIGDNFRGDNLFNFVPKSGGQAIAGAGLSNIFVNLYDTVSVVVYCNEMQYSDISNIFVETIGAGRFERGVYLDTDVSSDMYQNTFHNLSLENAKDAAIQVEGSVDNQFDLLNLTGSKVGIRVVDGQGTSFYRVFAQRSDTSVVLWNGNVLFDGLYTEGAGNGIGGTAWKQLGGQGSIKNSTLQVDDAATDTLFLLSGGKWLSIENTDMRNNGAIHISDSFGSLELKNTTCENTPIWEKVYDADKRRKIKTTNSYSWSNDKKWIDYKSGEIAENFYSKAGHFSKSYQSDTSYVSSLNLSGYRRNFLAYSDSLTVTTLTVGTPDTITVKHNNFIAPDGQQKAETLIYSGNNIGGSSTSFGTRDMLDSFDVGDTYVASVWLYPHFQHTFSAFTFRPYNNSANDASLSNLELEANKWTRVFAVGTISAKTSGELNIRLIAPGTQIVDGDSLSVWGLQIEKGSWPTTYIGTTSAGVSDDRLIINIGSDLELGGVTVTENVSSCNVTTTGAIGITAKSLISSTADGYLTMTNSAGSNFTMLRLGGNTSSFPAIKRNGTTFQLKLADDSNSAPLTCNTITSDGSIFAAVSSVLGISARSRLSSPANGNWLMTNSAGNDFSLLQLGGTTSSFPALKRSSAGIIARLSDDSADAAITASDVISTRVVRLKGYTVATLPAGTIGDIAYVTDATLPTYLGVLTGGGSVVTPVFYNGTAWVSH